MRFSNLYTWVIKWNWSSQIMSCWVCKILYYHDVLCSPAEYSLLIKHSTLYFQKISNIAHALSLSLSLSLSYSQILSTFVWTYYFSYSSLPLLNILCKETLFKIRREIYVLVYKDLNSITNPRKKLCWHVKLFERLK